LDEQEYDSRNNSGQPCRKFMLFICFISYFDERANERKEEIKEGKQNKDTPLTFWHVP
jgi:hypothetical protein